MAERQRGRIPNQDQGSNEHKEHESARYIRVARYPDEHSSETPYDAIRDAIHHAPCDLSVYRVRIGIDLIWHIAALGTRPPAELARRIEELLASGEPVTLDDELAASLFLRRAEQSKRGSWVEQQHFPRTKRRL